MNSAVSQEKLTHNQKSVYVVLGIIIMMCLGTVYSWSVFRLQVESLFQVGTTQSGYPYMVSLAFYALFMLLAGKYLDRYSPRMIVSLGGILVASGWVLSAYAPNIFLLTVTYGVLMGSGVGIAYGVPISVAAKWFPQQKGLIVGIVLIGFGLSPLITAPIARYLVAEYGVRSAFLILGIAFAFLIPVLAYPLNYPVNGSKSPELSHRAYQHNTAAMVKSKSFTGLYISYVFGTMIGLMMIGMTNNIGVELIGISPGRVALLISLFAVFNGLGRPVFGWLTDRLAHKAMLISYISIIVGAIIMLLAGKGSLVLYTVAFAIFWFNLGGWLAIAPTSTLSLYGSLHYSQNYGVVFTAYGVGAIIGVLASGVLKDVFQGYNSVFYLVIFICILGIVSSQTLIKTK